VQCLLALISCRLPVPDCRLAVARSWSRGARAGSSTELDHCPRDHAGTWSRAVRRAPELGHDATPLVHRFMVLEQGHSRTGPSPQVPESWSRGKGVGEQGPGWRVSDGCCLLGAEIWAVALGTWVGSQGCYSPARALSACAAAGLWLGLASWGMVVGLSARERLIYV
jgi:hypothetical protein